jgi:hypothetical protein
MMANVSKNKETRAINTEKSKRQAAQAAGYRAIVGGKDVSQIAKGAVTKAPKSQKSAVPTGLAGRLSTGRDS